MASDAMNNAQVLALMMRIHRENIISSEEADFSEDKLEAIFKELNMTLRQTVQKLSFDFIDIAAVTTITPEWKFMCLSFYCLHLLNRELKKDDLLSVTQTKDLRNCVNTMVHVGILQNLNPKLPHFLPLRQHKIGIETQYYMLKGTVCGLFKYAMLPTLRYHILPHILQGLLVALFQLAYCPIKKPFTYIDGDFIMSEDFYGELLGDQDRFQGYLETIQNSVSPAIYLKEIMILFRANSPNWFKKAVSATLTNCIKQKDGLENIVRTMLAGVYDNNTTIWKVIEIITQIVLSCVNSVDFESCMCPQIENLLKIATQTSGQDAIAFEKLYASIVKAIFSPKEEQSKLFLNKVLLTLRELSNNNNKVYTIQDASSFSRDVKQSVRVLHYIFVDAKDISLPSNLLAPYIGILFNMYVFTDHLDLKDIIHKYMKSSKKKGVKVLFENFVFNAVIPDVLIFRNDLIVSSDTNGFLFEFSDRGAKYDVAKRARITYKLCSSDTKLFLLYFGFLLNCLTNSDKYFPDTSLLQGEDEGNLSAFERKIAVYETLSIATVEGQWNERFTKGKIPEELIEYFNQVFLNAIKTGSHKNRSEEKCNLVFIVAMILEDIVQTKQFDLSQFEVVKSIRSLYNETSNAELKTLLDKILSKSSGDKPDTNEEDVVEEIVRQTYNESIPMKGHGLIALKRLVTSKHPKALERNQYIFNIFKENLSNRDTYIYQAAIKGISSMADLGTECTGMVLDTLCEEYTDFPKDEFGTDSNEMRLKIGEVLVQISKKLGEIAPNYKALLLNTFLNGTKDEDHLVRASALANLGEICKVLGYKLGSIITEILVCVHAIISSDKLPEPRRAAVQVIQQLLSGLGTDMLTSLKDDILPIYRTLKFLYNNDDDDIVKLQSQLALEELNKNMNHLMFPQAVLEADNKMVVLK